MHYMKVSKSQSVRQKNPSPNLAGQNRKFSRLKQLLPFKKNSKIWLLNLYFLAGYFYRKQYIKVLIRIRLSTWDKV